MRDRFLARLHEFARRAGVSAPTLVLLAGFVLLSIAVVAVVVRWWPQPAEGGLVVAPPAERSVADGASPTTAASDSARILAGAPSATATVCVHVVGAVRHPGVYTLPDGSRAETAVDAAGGMTRAASPSAINLAAKLSDGEQVVVPTKEPAGQSGPGAAGMAAAGSAGNAGSVTPGGKVDLNTADAALLDTLPGIGPAMAARIIADRQANGPFASVSELTRVQGIGPKKLDQLKPLVRVR